MPARTPVAGRAVVALVAASAITLSACTGGDGSDDPGSRATGDSPSASPSPTTAPEPIAGACYRLSAPQLAEAQVGVAPVPCTQPHTTVTYLVTSLSGITEPIDATALAANAERRCRAALRTFVRATPARLALSRVRSAWFVPSDQDLDAGARWLRCDLAVSRTDTTLMRLPAQAAGLLRRDSALDRYGRCARTDLAGVRAGRGGRVCALPHTWRAVAARRLGTARTPFPGPSIRGEVLGRCEGAARAFTDNSTRDIEVGWLPPDRAAWAQGQRFGLCWTRTRR
ncbi:septum formation family protein [Mumia sp. zg.B17]|uniref:septum formation family protein n=1 Tax=Mumia sp. zg.B17 TaxID=2855446 RepID=UPI001C6F559F|nr:septum formation family protein [Mumia sp. zg.B17]MBW9206430.1 septum formation family protein [Mumia sp. zg.B17]